MERSFLFSADAHEGPVWVPDQCRLYYTTQTHLDGRRRVDIEYLDFSVFNVCDAQELWEKLRSTAAFLLRPKTFLYDANMANGMRLSPDGRSLLIAEQGDESRDSIVSQLRLTSKDRLVLADNFEDKPFNSINKVISSREGHLIFSDPDYGFRQDFRPPSELEPNVYVKTASGELSCFRCGLEMPHGLALSPDETALFISDTSNDGAHGDGIELNRRKSVWKYAFDPITGAISGPGECCFAVAQGVPDGMVTIDDRLLVGGGDGVYVADLRGELIGKIPTPNHAVNLTPAGEGKHLFVTIDDGVMLFLDWRQAIT